MALDIEQEEFQFLGFFGIFKESFKIIVSWPKIFLQITLAFILPQYCLFLANDGISKLLITKIIHDSTLTNNDVTNSTSSEWVVYSLINVLFVILSVSLSLLTTSGVVYTVACIYTGKNFTFKKSLECGSKGVETAHDDFSMPFCITFAYVFIIAVIAVVFVTEFYIGGGKVGIGMKIIGFVFAILSIIGFLFMTMIWQLANVISVLEKFHWFEALLKSRELIRGKMGTSFAILLVLNLIAMPFIILVQTYSRFGIIERICFGYISIVLVGSLITLYGLIVQTIFYFVCKSYHHENIDKSLLADHLDEYLGDYVPLKEEAIQIRDFRV